MTDQTKLESAYRYANLLPTAAARRYASAYIGWLRDGAIGYEPERGRITRASAHEIKGKISEFKLWE